MKKIVTFLFLFSITFAFGQTLQVFYDNAPVNNGDTVYLNVTEPRSNSTFHFDIKNNSGDTVWAQIKKEDISMAQEALHTFCFGECYTGDQSDIMPIAAGQLLSHTNDSPYYFYTNYNPYNSSEISVVRFHIVNSRDEADEICYTAIYSLAQGVNQGKPDILSFTAYPNPAESHVTIKYNLKNSSSQGMNIVIKNIMGQIIYTGQVNGKSDQISIDVNALPAGLYLYSLESNGAILLTKKLYIR